MTKKARNSSIESLRIFFMFLILSIHIYGHGSGLNYDWIYSLGADWSTAWNLSLFSLGKVGVTGFIFISGYFGIKTSKHSLMQILSFTIFYTLLLNLFYSHYGIYDIINLFFSFNNWWFVSCYVFLMLLAPFVEESINKVSERKFKLLVVCMFVYTYVMRFLYKDNSHDIILFLTVYMGARYLRLYPSSSIALTLRRGGVMSLILILTAPVLVEQIGWKSDKVNAYFLQNNNILLFTVSYWFIYKCEQHAFYNAVVNRLAVGSLAIYLVTDYPDVRSTLDSWLLPFVLKGYGLLMIGGLCLTILCIDQVRRILFMLIESRLHRN